MLFLEPQVIKNLVARCGIPPLLVTELWRDTINMATLRREIFNWSWCTVPLKTQLLFVFTVPFLLF